MTTTAATFEALRDLITTTATTATPLAMELKLHPKYIETPALRLISDQLHAAITKPDGRLILSVPPQEGKTELVRAAIVKALRDQPDLRVILGSYNQSIASHGGAAIKNLIEANPDLGLRIAGDTRAKAEWKIAGHNGGLVARGRGSGVAGRAADCVRGDMHIVCEYGRLTAADAFSRGITRILAYDHTAGRTVWRNVEAARRIDSRPTLEITTEAGRVLVCTPDHRVHTGRGYVPAGDLRRGDTLVAVMDAVGQPCGEPDHALPRLPHDAQQGTSDTVRLVRASSDGPVAVYDFQVEGTSNFFAGGVLVHNCLIIDDPFKEGEAQSETIREEAWTWYREGLATRLSPGASVILINCIVASMRVLMGDGGWKRIDEIRPGDRVVALDGSGVKLATARVVAQKMSGVDPTITVKTDRLSLTTNGRHPYAVLRRTARRPRAQDIEWVRADELKVGDLVVTAKSLPSDFVADDTLPDGTSVDESRAWLLGYMLGDGWVTRHVRRNQAGNPASYAVCIARSKSTKEHKCDLDERVIAALGDWCPNRIYSTNHGYFRADWNAGGRLLLDLGYGAGAHGKRVPACVWRWSPELRRAFIKGYAEADGSLQRVNASRNSGAETWRVGSVSYDLLDDVRMLALTCGIRPTTVYRGKATTYQPPNSPKPITSAIHTLGLAFLEDAEEGRSLLSEYRHPNPAELRYEKVRSIHHGDAQPVYDITVEGVGNFVAEGYVVHNTRWHADDLAGRLVEQDAHAGWTVLNISAQCDNPDTDPLGRAYGEFLLSARGRTREQWEQRKLTAGSQTWNALYQGRPSPAEGGLVKRDWWQRYATPLWEEHPDGTCWATGFDELIMSADLTFKGSASSDRVAIGVWGRRGVHAYLLDLTVGRMEFVPTVAAFAKLAAKWPQATLKLVEDKANGPALMSMLAKRIPGIVPYDPGRIGKVPRLLAVAPLIEAGNVHVPTDSLASWADEYIEEHAGFPNAAHDDLVDMTSQALDRLLVRPLSQLGTTVTDMDDYDDWRIGY